MLRPAVASPSDTEPAGSRRRLLSAVPLAVRISRAASPRTLTVAAVVSAVSAILAGVQVLLSKVAVEAVVGTGGEEPTLAGALPAVVALVAASALVGVGTTAQTHLQRLLGERVQQHMWGRILGVTTRVDLNTFESHGFFDELQRVKANALTQPATMTQGLLNLIGGLLSLGGLAIAVVLLQPLLLPILLLGAGPLWFLTRRSSRLEFQFQLAQTPLTRLRIYLAELLVGRAEAKEIRAFDLADPLMERWSSAYATYQRALLAHVRRRLLLAGLSAAVIVVVTSAAIALLLVLVFDDRLSVATAAAGLIAIRLMSSRLEAVFRGIGAISEAALFIEDYDHFLTRPLESAPAGDAAVAPFEDLALEDVSFTYPGSAEPALRDVSLRLHAGETVALVGANGSGKTTLAKVLAQLVPPSEGRMLWDGADTAGLPAEARREHVGVIFQDFVRYQLSARENIGFGRASRIADEEAIGAAARAGGSDEFLAVLPSGYDTGLGKEFLGGHDLSVGQWQRVALSRAFFRDAPFLVLDEPTASMDAEGERALFDRVQELARGRSLLLISHRFSTVMSADRIYVLDAGRIVEQGDHEELIALEGVYARMFEAQARSYR